MIVNVQIKNFTALHNFIFNIQSIEQLKQTLRQSEQGKNKLQEVHSIVSQIDKRNNSHL